MKFKPTYDKNGKQRVIFEGEDGLEYFIYNDRTGYTIREMTKDDIPNWYDALNIRMRVPEALKPLKLAQVDTRLEQQQKEEVQGRTLLIFNPKNEIVGELQFEPDIERIAVARVWITLSNMALVKTKGVKIVKMLERMIKTTGYYDEVWAVNATDQLTKIV